MHAPKKTPQEKNVYNFCLMLIQLNVEQNPKKMLTFGIEYLDEQNNDVVFVVVVVMFQELSCFMPFLVSACFSLLICLGIFWITARDQQTFNFLYQKDLNYENYTKHQLKCGWRLHFWTQSINWFQVVLVSLIASMNQISRYIYLL